MFDQNQTASEIRANTIGQNLQANQHIGGLIISDNQIDKDLECKDNDPAPTGSDNIVIGVRKDQCTGLEPTMVSVPDVVGQPQAEAKAAITEVYLTAGAISKDYSDTVPAGHVISQDPLAGTSVEEGSPVNLTVAREPVASLSVTITNPADGTGFIQGPITVSGTASRPEAAISVNGYAASRQ